MFLVWRTSDARSFWLVAWLVKALFGASYVYKISALPETHRDTAMASPVQKALSKLKSSLEAGQPYEGHEMLKTAFYRFRSRRQLENSYALAAGGAHLQLKLGQPNCGVELVVMLVDAYAADGAPADEELPRLLSLLSALPTEPATEGGDAPVEGCAKVAAAARKWLNKVGGAEHVPRLEGAVAAHITRCLGWAGLGAAMPHYAKSADLGAFAAALADAASNGAPEEEDLFLARAALQVACATPQASANGAVERSRALLAAYKEGRGRELPSTPLVHFVDLFLEALARGSGSLAQLLLQRYKLTLERDPSLEQLARRCADLYTPPAGGSAMRGLPPAFRDILQQLMAPPPAS